jgi:hypothetical protein
MQDICGINMSPKTITYFIAGLFCEHSNGKLFYLKACISGKCDRCGNFSFLGECIHEISLHEFGQQLVDVKKI